MRTPIRLSQGQLNTLATCPRKFQHTYLDQVGSYPNPESQERLLWGTHFHQLMQQRELGVPIEVMVREDKALQHCLTTFEQAAPEVFRSSQLAYRDCEHSRTLNFQGYLLTVVYDLLMIDSQQAQILDWKTYPRPQNPRWLAENWQTRLYPFVLTETSDYSPEQITLTYWFVQVQNTATPIPQSLAFAYNAEWHERNRQDLAQLLSQLTVWLRDYQSGHPFPQVGIEAHHCSVCPFAHRCRRTPETQQGMPEPDRAMLDLTAIKEIPL